MAPKVTIVVICGLVRDRIELARLDAKYNIEYNDTFDWMEHMFVKEDTPVDAHDISADIAAFVKSYKNRSISAVFSSCDHGVAIAAILAYQLALPCPNPKQLLLTHHKYYQRLQLKSAVPEAVPTFMILDPTRPDLQGRTFPFFMKPVKSVLSSHAYKITDQAAFALALHAPHPPAAFLKEFNKLVTMAAGQMSHDCCKVLCEELVSGQQFTVDGFVYGSEVTILGIVDSIMYPGTMSFASFEYPSKLPEHIQDKAVNISVRAIKGLGLTNTTFNIEYFYTPETEDLKIIEVNPRFSGQFGDIYEKVDGTNTYDAAVGIACQEVPAFAPRRGKYTVAASFVMRVFENKTVLSVPSASDIAQVQQEFPDAKVFVLVEKGTKLSDYIQDSGSFRYCLVHLGAHSFAELYKAYETCKGLLKFTLV